MSRAFTLVEMVVVLTIIALTAHLALRALAPYRERQLVAVADRQLDDLRKAVYDRDADGDLVGFLADMGRLVVPTNGTLAELWVLPAGAQPYRICRVTESTLVKGIPAADRAELLSETVSVPTGWRGPYLRLGVGKNRLYDPWGNKIETPDAAGLARIAVTNGEAVSVSHFGPTAQKSGQRTVSLVPESGATSRVCLNVTSSDGTAGTVAWRWYGPASGMVTGGVVRASCPGQVMLEGLTPGVRVIVDSVTHVPRVIAVRPGDNFIAVDLRKP